MRKERESEKETEETERSDSKKSLRQGKEKSYFVYLVGNGFTRKQAEARKIYA